MPNIKFVGVVARNDPTNEPSQTTKNIETALAIENQNKKNGIRF